MYTSFLQEMSSITYLDVSAIERSVVRGDVSWDLKMTSTIEKSPLQSVRYVEVFLWEFDHYFIRSWEKCREVPATKDVHYKEVSL